MLLCGLNAANTQFKVGLLVYSYILYVGRLAYQHGPTDFRVGLCRYFVGAGPEKHHTQTRDGPESRCEIQSEVQGL